MPELKHVVEWSDYKGMTLYTLQNWHFTGFKIIKFTVYSKWDFEIALSSSLGFFTSRYFAMKYRKSKYMSGIRLWCVDLETGKYDRYIGTIYSDRLALYLLKNLAIKRSKQIKLDNFLKDK
ncbi:MAG: hypothetical protein COA63_013960 [Methylophaga sp.]|nr:hypothetical protein [Methylophaga sp.]